MANRIDLDTVRRYRFFRGRTWRVGYDAVYALALARAEARAESLGLLVQWEQEQESYRDVYGEDPPKGVSFYTVIVTSPDDPHDVLASLGFVEDGDRAHQRATEGYLFLEALETLDARREKTACIEAEALAQRATYAGPPA